MFESELQSLLFFLSSHLMRVSMQVTFTFTLVSYVLLERIRYTKVGREVREKVSASLTVQATSKDTLVIARLRLGASITQSIK